MELAIALAHRATVGEAFTTTGEDPAIFFIFSASLESFGEGSFSLFTGGEIRYVVALVPLAWMMKISLAHLGLRDFCTLSTDPRVFEPNHPNMEDNIDGHSIV